jgi:hypothetical protein
MVHNTQMGIYPDLSSIKAIRILNSSDGTVIYENIIDDENPMQTVKKIYNDLPNKHDVVVKVLVSISSTHELNSKPFYDWILINL